MGFNVKEIHLHLWKMVKASTESSYTFMKRHPWVSGAFLVFLILYIFLSYIYSFLVYMSPFLVCVLIFVRIFWSSEQTQLRYVKREEEKGRVEPKYTPKVPNNGKREITLSKYPSQNATSRRRNFRAKKWDVYGGLEEKAKDLSAVFYNEFTKRNTEKGESSLDAKKFRTPKSQGLRSEPSIEIEKMEDLDDEDEEAQEDRNKAIEWTEDDQKNLMNLGVSEMERNKRLECLMKRRRERKLLKLQVENGLIDKKSIAPLITSRGKNFDSSKDFEGFDGLEMPGSAPSLRPQSPFDIPYDPSEEKPILTGDSFHQEFSFLHKDIAFCRHESFTFGHTFPSETKQEARDKLAYSHFRRLSDKGNHDWLIDQLMYGECGERGFQAPNSLSEGEGTTHEVDGNFKTNIDNMKDEKVEKAQETESMLDQTSEPSLIPNISKVEPTSVLHKQSFPKPQGRLFSFPMSNTTNITESMYDIVPCPIDKRQETMFLPDRRICHTPTYSIASDLQVEVSEVGSPASTSSSTDRGSVLYDGDIDRDVSSGSEDLWGTSFNARQARGGRTEEDVAEENNNSKDLVSPIALRLIDEENVADVSSMSSNPDIPDDTPTNPTNRQSDHNIFGYMKYSVEIPESSNSYVPYPHRELVDSSVYHSPDETDSGKPMEFSNLSENSMNEAQVINDGNTSSTIEHDNIENSRRNEDHGTSILRQESIDEASIYSVTSSPRSVLPEKTMADEVSPLAFDENMNIGAEQSSMEGETLNTEPPPHTMPQNIQPLVDDTTNESHNVDYNQSQEQTNPVENFIEESSTIDNMKDEEVHNKEKQDELKNDDEEKVQNSTVLARQEAAKSASQINEMTMEHLLDKKSRDLVVDDKVSLTENVEDVKNEKPTSSNVHEALPQQRVDDQTNPNKETNEEKVEDS